jgi:hypothetical protein
MLTASLATATTITFDGTGAPAGFFATTSLTNLYASNGVLFSGGGAIVNQSGNFGINARSGTDFLGYNLLSYATGPLTMTFVANMSEFSIFASGGNDAATFTASFRDASNVLLGTVIAANTIGNYVQIQSALAGIRSVVITTTSVSYVYDDLSFTIPEPSSALLLGTGLMAVLVRKPRHSTGA